MENKLFEHIKHRFEESRSDLGWNEPPADAFDQAMSRMNQVTSQDKTPKKRLWPFFFLSLFLCSSVFLTREFQIRQNQIETTSEQFYSKKTGETNNDLVVETIKDYFTNSNIQLTSKATTSSTKSINLSNNYISAAPITELSADYNKGTVVSSPSIMYRQQKTKSPLLISSLKELPIPSREIRALNLSTIDLNQEYTKDKRFQLTALSGRNYSSLKMQSLDELGYELKDYQNYYSGYSFEIGGMLDLGKKFGLQGSIGYSKINNSSLFYKLEDAGSLNFVYDNKGNMNYNLQEVMTPLGAVNSDINLEMNHANMDSAELSQNANVQQQLYLISAGIGISYQLFDCNKFCFSLNGNGYLNRITKTKTVAQFSLMDKNTMSMGDHHFERAEIIGLSKNFVSISTGIAFSYAIADDFNLLCTVSKLTSVSSLRQSADPITSLNSYNTSIGFAKTFN